MILAGRTALVTGGSRGIGRDACVEFAKAGADLIVHYSTERDEAEEVVAEIARMGRRALATRADVTDEDQVREMFDEVTRFTTQLDIVFNNAGIYPSAGFETMTVEAFDKVLAVNVRGPFLVTRSAFPLLKRSTCGRVINVGSIMALKGTPGALHYATSKMAVVGLTRALANELAPFGITANCVVPSMVHTATAVRDYGAWSEAIVAEQAIKIPQEPKHVMGLLLFLASSESAFITGQTIVADGGRVFV